MTVLLVSLGLSLALQASSIPSTPDLGTEEGRCRAGESGPAFLVNVRGLKDRRGDLKLEVYPANDKDFLADDNILIGQGKTFRRVVVPVPTDTSPKLCIRVPRPGRYSVSLLHDRNGNRKFDWMRDGIGFVGNPKLRRSAPAAMSASAVAGSRPTEISITVNYLRGLSMRPLRD